MNAEAQRVALAEWEGWSLIEHRDSEITGPKSWLSGLNPAPDEIVAVIEAYSGIERKPNESDYGWETLPDYLSDLNAVARLEAGLNEEQQTAYTDWFWHNLEPLEYHGDHPDTGDAIMSVGVWQILTASPAQRCAALLRTLGLWKE